MLAPLVTERPTQKALILMAELEEAESGDRGRARGWLARAVYAPRDAAWTADGVVLQEWAPISPVTGTIDAVEWKVPIAEIEGPKLEIDAAELMPPAAEADEAADEEEKVEERTAEPAAAPNVVNVVATGAVRSDSGPTERSTGGTAESRARAANAAAGGTSGEPNAVVPPDSGAIAAEADEASAASPGEPPRPDDPGVADEEEEEGARALPGFLRRTGSAARRQA
jgi:HemY protein